MDDVKLGEILARLTGLQGSIDEIKKRLDDHYVTQEQFAPVERIVYAMVGLILIGFIASLTALVYVRHV